MIESKGEKDTQKHLAGKPVALVHANISQIILLRVGGSWILCKNIPKLEQQSQILDCTPTLGKWVMLENQLNLALTLPLIRL